MRTPLDGGVNAANPSLGPSAIDRFLSCGCRQPATPFALFYSPSATQRPHLAEITIRRAFSTRLPWGGHLVLRSINWRKVAPRGWRRRGTSGAREWPVGACRRGTYGDDGVDRLVYFPHRVWGVPGGLGQSDARHLDHPGPA